MAKKIAKHTIDDTVWSTVKIFKTCIINLLQEITLTYTGGCWICVWDKTPHLVYTYDDFLRGENDGLPFLLYCLIFLL